MRRFCPVACCSGEGLMRQFCSFARVVREEREDREKEKRTEEMIDGRFIKGEQRNRDNDVKEKRGLKGGYGR